MQALPRPVAEGLLARLAGAPEEVAAAVLLFACDGASFVYGHNLCVDGGFLSAWQAAEGPA